MNRSTSGPTLAKLLSKLKVSNFDILRKHDIPHSHAENIIINLDDDGPGTHWVALNKRHKLYFDSYGRPPPKEVPNGYRYNRKTIEGIKQEDCGQLCCLWLHYVNHQSPEAFFKLFKTLY